jgi:hypothetical protein
MLLLQLLLASCSLQDTLCAPPYSTSHGPKFTSLQQWWRFSS